MPSPLPVQMHTPVDHHLTSVMFLGVETSSITASTSLLFWFVVLFVRAVCDILISERWSWYFAGRAIERRCAGSGSVDLASGFSVVCSFY